MEITFEVYMEEAKPQAVSYSILNADGITIGTVEGYTNDYEEFFPVVKIYEPQYQGLGIGFRAFKKVYDELIVHTPISIIVGSWHKGGEFTDYQDGMSSNLIVFQNCQKTNTDAKQCAFQTPTGKWALKLGYTHCEVRSIFDHEIVVHFTKPPSLLPL